MKKVTGQQIKSHNSNMILRIIYNSDRISRADIARMTGLTRTTVSEAVARLIENGLLTEVGMGVSGGGKPPIMLSVVDDSRYLIGLDLADSEFRGALVNLRGKIKKRFSLPIRDRDGEGALALVYKVIDRLRSMANGTTVGIGIGTPGLIDVERGVVRRVGHIDWQNLFLRDLLQERYKLPVHISNDCQTAALAEFTFGENRNADNLIVVKIGRGTGAGIVVNRQLFHGDAFGAGEIGHVTMVEEGELCACGKYGCLETLTCSRTIVRHAREIAGSDPQSPLNRLVASPEEIDIDAVARAIELGCEPLRRVVAEAGRQLGIVLSHLVGALDIQRIVIAGNVSALGPALIDPIRKEFRRRTLKELADETTISVSALGNDIVVLGAAALLLNNEMLLP